MDLTGKALAEVKGSTFRPTEEKITSACETASYRSLLFVDPENEDGPKAVVIGLNPSTARAGQSDCTLTKISKVLHVFGFSQLTMLNLYIYRATSPSDLNRAISESKSSATEPRKPLYNRL